MVKKYVRVARSSLPWPGISARAYWSRSARRQVRIVQPLFLGIPFSVLVSTGGRLVQVAPVVKILCLTCVVRVFRVAQEAHAVFFVVRSLRSLLPPITS